MFGSKRSTARAAAHLLETARAAARAPALYGPGRIPDTIDGRFESMVLHVGLLVDRLQRNGGAGQATAQALFDALFRDFDDAIRELGAGDMSVAKKVRRMGEAFYGRLKAYRAAIEGGEPALADALERNVFDAGEADPAFLRALAGYVRSAAEALASAPVEALAAGEAPAWPALPG